MLTLKLARFGTNKIFDIAQVLHWLGELTGASPARRLIMLAVLRRVLTVEELEKVSVMGDPLVVTRVIEAQRKLALTLLDLAVHDQDVEEEEELFERAISDFSRALHTAGVSPHPVGTVRPPLDRPTIVPGEEAAQTH